MTPFRGANNLDVPIDPSVLAEITERINQLDPEERAELPAKGFRELIQFAFEGVKLDKSGRGLKLAIQRFVAVTFFMQPDGTVCVAEKTYKRCPAVVLRPIKSAQLGRLPQLKMSPKQMRKLFDEFLDRWLGEAT